MGNKKDFIDVQEERMTRGQKLLASSGGIVGCIDLLMVQTFLFYYYTDVMLINAAFVGTLFLVVRIVAACAAPIFGIFIDRTTTPWGKYRPYFIILGIPSAIMGFLTFTVIDVAQPGKYIYVIITYLFYCVFSSISGIPRGAMGPTLTKNIQDRMSLGLMGYLFAVLGSMAATVGAPVMVQLFGGNNEARGYSLTMLVFGVLAVMLAMLQCVFLKEKYPIVNKTDRPKYSMKQMFTASFSNRVANIVLLLSFSINLATGIRSAVTLHYLKYHFGRPGLIAQIGLLAMISLFGGAFLSPIITKRIGIKVNLMISNLVAILTFALIIFVPATDNGIVLFIILYAVNGFFNGLSMPAQSTLLPNAIDYCEWKYGMNTGAFMTSVNSFVSTTATAFAGIIVGMVLNRSGYRADTEITQTALSGIKLLMSIIPAVACIISLSVIWLGNTEKQHEIVVRELKKRREVEQAEDQMNEVSMNQTRLMVTIDEIEPATDKRAESLI